MPTVEDYFDDETDIPLPSSSKPRALQGEGHKGALLEEITDNDDFDYGQMADQGRGIFGENAVAPPPTQSRTSGSAKGKDVVRNNGNEDGELRPSGSGSGPGAGMPANTPMGGFMGDMMKFQQAEDERMERLRKQLGNTKVAADPSAYKEWNSVYPIYFDAKVSVNNGRRVPRPSGMWWPQATQISQACRSLGLPSVLEPDRVHPADWANPGRVKVQFEKDGRFINPIVKNRTQLYRHLASQMQQMNPTLAYSPDTKPSPASTSATKTKPAKATPNPKTTGAKSKSKSKPSSSTANVKSRRPPTRPPTAPQPVPHLDDRLPLHSPVVATGVALSSIKRELESEKEAKKKGITGGGAGGLGGAGEGEGGKEKVPKMKRVVVRGKR